VSGRLAGGVSTEAENFASHDYVNDRLAGGESTGAVKIRMHSGLNRLTPMSADPQSTNVEARTDHPRVLIPRNRQRTVINVGRLGDVTHCSNLCFEAHEYALYMPYSYFSSTDIAVTGDASTSENVWLQSQLSELYSLV
jgi:hypothetical protein